MDQQTPSAMSAALPAVRNYTAEELKAAVLAKLTYSVGKNSVAASPRDWFLAVAFATRDIVVERWIASTNAVYQDGRKRVYYLSLEFLIGRLLYDAITNLGIVEPMTAALSQLGLDLAHLQRSSSPTRRSATAASAGSPPASWTAWRRCRSPHPDTAFATTTASSGRSSATAGSRRFPRIGSRHGNPWEFERPEVNYAIGFGGWVEAVADGEESVRHVWHPDETVEAVGLRHADRRLARPPRQHAATVVGARRRSAEARRLQRRRLHRRPFGHRARRGDLQGALSERRDPGRPGAAAAAGIFLRLGLAARPRPPPRQAVWRHPHPARPRRGSAQRHASGDRRRRADAHSRRPQPHRVGGGVGDHQEGLLLHQPYAAARGAGELAGAVDGAAAAAPHADHLPHQRDPSRRRAQERPRRSRPALRRLAD